MTIALLSQVNEAEESVARGDFSHAVSIQSDMAKAGTPEAAVAADIIDRILLNAMHERATADEVRPT